MGSSGKPVAVTVNEPLAPTVTVVVLALVIIGAWSTVRVKFWVVFPEVLVALNMIGYVPPVPATGVPPRTPVAGVNVTPAGRSEEHTSELQSQSNLVCRLLLEK